MSKEKSQETIQKISWKNYKTYKTYEEADIQRKTLLNKEEYVKVRRTGPGGSRFTVKVGTPIKSKGDKNATKW